MWWKFWENGNKVGKLPERMTQQLAWRFGISVDTMAGLKHASKSGPMNTLLVRVYDPKLLEGDSPVIRRYADLDTQESAIQFECRWRSRSQRLEDVVDLRPSATA